MSNTDGTENTTLVTCTGTDKHNLHVGTKAEAISKTAHKQYAVQIGAFLPNLVNVYALMILVGIQVRINAEKFRYLLPEMPTELMIVPVYTNMQQKKQAVIRAIRRRIVFERSTRSKCGFSCVWVWPA